MANEPKFLVGQLNGEEFETGVEYEAVSEDIYYDAGKVDTMKSKIDNFAMGYGDFFQYKLNQDLTIPALRSKIVTDLIDLNGHCLEVDGILEIT